ncbi:MAG: hypothetical protein WEB59_00640 [Thermoanaerobaculia bacterium]
MDGIALNKLGTAELLKLFAEVLDELRTRRVIRSTNNPVADYTEQLVACALSLELRTKSTTGFDAVDSAGRRYEIKGRRPTSRNRSTQLSAIRGLEQKHFDFLAGVLFNEDFTVASACLIPHDVVARLAKYRAHVNASILHLRPGLWSEPGVQDISAQVRAAQPAVCSAVSRQ